MGRGTLRGYLLQIASRGRRGLNQRTVVIDQDRTFLTYGETIAVLLDEPDSDEGIDFAIDASHRNAREQVDRLHVLEPVPNDLENLELLGAEHLFELVNHGAFPLRNLEALDTFERPFIMKKIC